ncbi:hypothetical protein [Chelatococcus sp. XZ-Ab1]|uniref:hypothetical protein n=1 Tax=Chelatococcus sp. XZ-Ab1 TaxID=3034027 RepID=UPI0023E37E9B|nr:hypothetical protein [Chelatococcus sp. XZ-Ab1]
MTTFHAPTLHVVFWCPYRDDKYEIYETVAAPGSALKTAAGLSDCGYPAEAVEYRPLLAGARVASVGTIAAMFFASVGFLLGLLV